MITQTGNSHSMGQLGMFLETPIITPPCFVRPFTVCRYFQFISIFDKIKAASVIFSVSQVSVRQIMS